MPKKKRRSLHIPSSVSHHPSLSLSSHNNGTRGSNISGGRDSVNESLKALRNEEASAASIRPPPVSSVHPSLRPLLDVPEHPPLCNRNRGALSARGRRIPGPAAPPSWSLLDSHHPPGRTRGTDIDVQGDRHGVMIAQRPALPGGRSIIQKSLLNIVLTSMARNWDWHLQHDREYLHCLPVNLRIALLSDLPRCASPETLKRSSGTLRALFPDTVGVVRLDLCNAIGSWLPQSSNLKAELLCRLEVPQALVSSTRPGLEPGADGEEVDLPDSWEDAAIDERRGQAGLPLTNALQSRYPYLLHLSLALRPSVSTQPNMVVASWSSLLSITAHLSTLESLSLSFWPPPTLTPHAAAASVFFAHPASRALPNVTYGGTNMYTAMDSNWREAAGILRTLSRHLYCLKWLDLTGCGEWLEALSWDASGTIDDESTSGLRLPENGPDWNGTWRNVQHLGLGIGHVIAALPGDHEDLSNLPIAADVDHYPALDFDGTSSFRVQPPQSTGIASNCTDEGGLSRQDLEVGDRRRYLTKRNHETALARQRTARRVAKQLRAMREKAGGKWIEVTGLDEQS